MQLFLNDIHYLVDKIHKIRKSVISGLLHISEVIKMDKIFSAVQISLPVLFMIANKFNSRRTLDLTGKTALITNGSSGTSLKICIKLAQYGCNLVIIDSVPANETLKKIQEFNVRSVVFQVDLSNEKEVEELRTKVMKEFQKVNYVVNVVGSYCYSTIFENSSEVVRRILERQSSSVKNVRKYS